MSVPLFTYTRQAISLSDSLTAFASVIGSKQAKAILYTSKRCDLAIFSEGVLHGDDGQPFDVASVFEVRVFNESAELRWLNDPGAEQRHRAVILTEQDSADTLQGWQHEEQPSVIEMLPQTYLLWGEGTGHAPADGWSELAAARIGKFSIPLAGVQANQRVLLHSVEYLVEQKHGNVVILDERLCKLGVEHG